MKKTIALLLAMAGMAMGSYTVITPSSEPISINGLGDSYMSSNYETRGNITLAFSLSSNGLKLGNYNDSSALAMFHTDTMGVGLAIGEYKASIELYKQVASQYDFNQFITLSPATYYSVVLSSYVIDHIVTEEESDDNVTNTYWSATLYSWKVNEDGELSTTKSPQTKSWVIQDTVLDFTLLTLNPDAIQSAHLYTSVLTGADAKEAAKLIVVDSFINPPNTPEIDNDSPAAPEPTTATLSLLALAGLAARRRRK